MFSRFLGARFQAGLGVSRDLAMPAVVVSTLAIMLLPLPPMAVDTLIAINITVSLLMVLTAVQVGKPLEFSVFPSLLLITTLFRLSLNVSTTRLILLDGSDGVDAAGRIVETFGQFIVGGSYLVGIVVFLILTLINFVVITKGAGRIAEVSARFTLDALPGKQMSIDSDLAAGLVSQPEARRRRETLAQETDFYGAMDGASKFVRGDAIAGLIITALNIVGGLIVGVAQNGMSFANAAETYTVLTVGDALVSQIPSLLISTASGVVITRVADSRRLGHQVGSQIFGNPRTLAGGAGIVLLLALVPNMPMAPFVMLAAVLATLAKLDPFKRDRDAPPADDAAKVAEVPEGDLDLTELLPVDILQLEVGYSLVPLVDSKTDGEVLRRIAGLRKTMAKELGVVLPPVHVCDNLELGPGEYRMLIHGVEAARGTLMTDRLLAMDPGDARGNIEGIDTREPAFGLPALWIRPGDRTKAEVAGYTVVEPATVVVTHLNEILRREAFQLVGRTELQQLLDVVAERNAKVVEELIPTQLSHSEVLTVVRGLLREQVSVRDMRSILESLADSARTSKAPMHLIEGVRQRLGPSIVQTLVTGADRTLHAAILDAATEESLRSNLVRADNDVTLALDLPTAQGLIQQLQQAVEAMQAQGHPPVVVVPPDLRSALWTFVSRFVSPLAVISHRELPPRVQVSTERTISAALGGPKRPAPLPTPPAASPPHSAAPAPRAPTRPLAAAPPP